MDMNKVDMNAESKVFVGETLNEVLFRLYGTKRKTIKKKKKKKKKKEKTDMELLVEMLNMRGEEYKQRMYNEHCKDCGHQRINCVCREEEIPMICQYLL